MWKNKSEISTHNTSHAFIIHAVLVYTSHTKPYNQKMTSKIIVSKLQVFILLIYFPVSLDRKKKKEEINFLRHGMVDSQYSVALV